MLLSRSHRQPVKLTQAALADAAKFLGRWRSDVAEWASQPSRPIPPETAGKIRGAFDEDLNTVAALELLHDVESDHDIPPGAKFETFVFVDRVLGLELAREIGRPNRATRVAESSGTGEAKAAGHGRGRRGARQRGQRVTAFS